MESVPNFIGGQWTAASAHEFSNVINPATAEVLAHVPLDGAEEVDRAVQAASQAFPDWRQTPPEDRIQYLFRLKQLLEDNLDELARTITIENGKNAGRVERRTAAGHRERGGRLRHPYADAGLQP